MSKISESEMESYSNRISYSYKSSTSSFTIISCNTTKDDVKLSLKGALEGGLTNMAASINGIVSNRKYASMEQLYGYPSNFSTGLITANKEKITLEYYYTAIINKQNYSSLSGSLNQKTSKKLKPLNLCYNQFKFNKLNHYEISILYFSVYFNTISECTRI